MHSQSNVKGVLYNRVRADPKFLYFLKNIAVA